jgi:DNA-binding response OmpR family regulator
MFELQMEMALHTILIADDERHIRTLLRTVLETPDRQFVEAADGTQALRVAIERQPSLATLDWMMPGLDGVEVAHRIRMTSEIANVPIILISAVGIPADKSLVDALKLYAYIPKPMDLSALKVCVQGALAR